MDAVEASLVEKSGRSVWTIACVFHVMTGTTFNLSLYEVPMDSGATLNYALS